MSEALFGHPVFITGTMSLKVARTVWMNSARLFSPTKTTCHKIKNEMQCYHFLQLWSPGICTRCAKWSNSQCDWYFKVTKQLIIMHILYKQPYYCNSQQYSCITITCTGMQCSVLGIFWPRTVWKWCLTLCDFILFLTSKKDLMGRYFESLQVALGAAETAFKHLAWNRFQYIFDE